MALARAPHLAINSVGSLAAAMALEKVPGLDLPWAESLAMPTAFAKGGS